MVAAQQTALLKFDHEEHGDFQPIAAERDVLAKKRRAGLNRLDLLAKKVRAEERRSLKPGAEYVSDELDTRLSAYRMEYEKRCDELITMAAPTATASRPPPGQKAIPIPAVRLPKASTPLEPLAGPDGGPIDLYLHQLYHEKLHAALSVGHPPAGAREVALNQVVGYLNRSLVNVTLASGGVWYVTVQSDLESHVMHSKRWDDKEWLIILGSPGRLPNEAAADLGKRERNAFEKQSFINMWITHHSRRQSPTMVFEPPRCVKTIEAGGVCTTVYVEPVTSDFNLWSGADMPPESVTGENAPPHMEIAADWERSVRECFSEHTEPEIHDLFDRLAHALQCPGVLPGAAVVFRGEEGTGKGALVQILARILGQGYLQHAKTIEGVTGQYATTYGKVLVFIDEVFWAGNHGPGEVLKKIVTESALDVNRKYLDPMRVANVAHVFIASNHDQAVFAGTSARRWAMYCTTSNGGRPRDLRRFFTLEALQQIAAFLYTRDLSDFDPTVLPASAELAEQKIRSLRPFGVDEFCLRLITGNSTMLGTPVEKGLLYQEYTKLAGARPLSLGVFFRDLKRRLPYATKRMGAQGRDGTCATLPPLEEARKVFAAYLRVQPEDLDGMPVDEPALAPALAPVRPRPAPRLTADQRQMLPLLVAFHQECRAREEGANQFAAARWQRETVEINEAISARAEAEKGTGAYSATAAPTACQTDDEAAELLRRLLG